LPVFWMAAFRLKDRKIFSEELIISLAAIFAAVSGYAWDGVLALIVADVGFALRDNFLGDRREEAEEALGQSSADDPMLKPHWVNLLETLFTPVALLLFLLALILSLVLGKAEAGLWIHRSLILLIAASPLVTTVILALTCDFGKLAARDRGVAFSGCRSIRTAAALTSLVFNKTGTITEGNYRVSGLYPVRITEQQLLYLAAYAEASSEHPLAKAITAAAGVKVDTAQIARSRMEPGMGAIVQLKNGQILTAGSIELMDKLGLAEEAVPGLGVAVYVAVGKTFVGRIDLEDTIRPGARETVEQLRKQGVVNVALMTGDNSISASAIGKEVGISEIYADYLPKDKIDRISAIVKAQKKNERLAYVTGAGSDIPAQRLADLGIILGEGEGATGTRVNIPSGELTALPNVVRCAKRVRTASLCAVILLLVAKLVSVVLGLLGLFPLFCAVLLDIAAALLCGVLAKNLKNEA
ncbi:MAG: HAD-IC family P-type ATPase, partial [bacterium]